MQKPSCAQRGVARRVRLGMFALTAIAAASAAFAQAQAPAAPANPPMPVSVPPPTFAIKGFDIKGENPLGDAETQSLLAPYVRNDASIETLQQAAGTLEKALRDHGFGLHRVALPPQEVGKTVTLNIVKFTIASVGIEGRSIYSEANVRRTLPELKEGTTPNFSTLAIQTAIANENPNKLIQVGLKESEELDKIDAVIVVKEQKPWNIGVGISNAGTSNSGRDRFTVTGSNTNLWDLDHQIVGAYTTSLQHPGDVRQFGLSYKVPLYAMGSVVTFNATKSDVIGNFGTFTSTGAGYTLGGAYTYYFAPEGGRRSYASFGLDDKLFKATEVSGVSVGVDRRSLPATVGYTARTESDKYVFGYDVALSLNTGAGDNDTLASYKQEEPRIDTVHFKVLRGNVTYVAPFAKDWLLTARGSWQMSPDVLISGEQFGLGGLGSVRGTDIDRPITGDSGLSATIEAMTPEVWAGTRLLGFVDGGMLWNEKANGTSKPSSDHLMSAGLGLRYVKDTFALSLDYGRIIVGSRIDPSFNSAAPKKGNQRFYVSALVRF